LISTTRPGTSGINTVSSKGFKVPEIEIVWSKTDGVTIIPSTLRIAACLLMVLLLEVPDLQALKITEDAIIKRRLKKLFLNINSVIICGL
jgi:hypothetical protein